MFNIEQAIQNWKRRLRSNPAFEDGDIAEFESHLREEVERLKAEGLSEEEAFSKAAEEIGELEPIGDELYKSRATQKAGPVPPWKQSSWMPSMFSNYLKVARRNILKNKGISIINVLGLSAGILACLLITFYVQHEWSYDQFHEKSDQIYRVTRQVSEEDSEQIRGELEGPFAQNITRDIPEVVDAFRIVNKNETLIRRNENSTYESEGFYSDPSIFDVFDLTIISQENNELLAEPSTVVITESLAKKLFGQEDPVGNDLYLDQEEDPYRVTAVISDLPANSHISFHFLLPMPKQLYGLDQSQWDGFSAFFTYLLLDENADPETVEQKIPNWGETHYEEGHFETHSYRLQPLSDIHLYSKLEQELQPERIGEISYLYIFVSVALLILGIAVVNFINLMIVKSADRTREIGLRKVLGADKGDIRKQFIGESLILVSVAALLALVFAEFFLKLFNGFLNISLALDYLENLPLVGLFLLTVSGTVFLASLYPSLILSKFSPSQSLQGKTTQITDKFTIRKGMIVFQFCITILLVICTLIVWNQLNFVQNTWLGLNEKQVMSLEIPSRTSGSLFNALSDKVTNLTGVEGVTASMTVPSKTSSTLRAEVNSRQIQVNGNMVDEAFFSVLEINLAAGKGFSEQAQGQLDSKVIVNESFLETVGWDKEEAIGKEISILRLPFQVTGVVEDFHYESFREQIAPQVIQYHHSAAVPRYLTVRFNVTSLSGLIPELHKMWGEIYPSHPFEYFFLEDSFEQLYTSERRLARIFSVFALLAILISVMGLLSLVGYSIRRRQKEICIRKVLGATTERILVLISVDFMKLIFVGFIVAVPIAWYLMNHWLTDFAYRIELGLIPFVIAGIIVVLIALLIACWQSFKTAKMNPVENLRSE